MNVSIGENCLTDNILHRHELKSFSTPYSHCRSNLDYALQLEEQDYSELLNPENLCYEDFNGLTVIRNHSFFNDPIFHGFHINGFEFTHHDVIKNSDHIESYRRKIERLIIKRNESCFRFFYHYRYSENFNLDEITKKAEKFLSFYKSGCKFIIFTQNIIPREVQKHIDAKSQNENIILFTFNTHDLWAGDNDDVFWARVDDNLFKEMFSHLSIKKQ